MSAYYASTVGVRQQTAGPDARGAGGSDMRRTKWFDRTFPPIADNGLLPGILERLDGTPARLQAMVQGATVHAAETGWSAAKELGHFADLEPLWLARVQDILA